jgi:hypothetical protein
MEWRTFSDRLIFSGLGLSDFWKGSVSREYLSPGAYLFKRINM